VHVATGCPQAIAAPHEPIRSSRMIAGIDAVARGGADAHAATCPPIAGNSSVTGSITARTHRSTR
jgi:hypothetical protein